MGERGGLGVTRSRSEYRAAPIPTVAGLADVELVHPADHHGDALAALMLDAYRGTIDDEGETLDDARDVVADYLARILRSHSFVLLDRETPVAFSFVVVVGGMHYIDPVVVAARRKRCGLGRTVVGRSLASLASAGCDEAGATITDGNLASERLFTGLGFRRIGAWT